MIIEDPNSAVTVELIGGLGNQLFQYATGLEQSRRLECQLLLDTSYFNTGRRDFELADFRFEAVAFFPANKSRKLRLPFNPSRRRVWMESDFTYDPTVNSIPPGTRLEGYFQSWRYFPKVGEQIRSQVFDLRQPSDWFTETYHALEGRRWLGIHLRRGDYLHERYLRNFGVASIEYIRRAVRLMRSIEGDLRPLVFSDDPALVRAELERAEMLDLAAAVVQPPPESSALESLLLLSLASQVIMSNSSFSWWAGFLGEKPDRTVIAPRPWFASLPHDTRDLLLPQWITLDGRENLS